jgi:hypothetical protein
MLNQELGILEGSLAVELLRADHFVVEAASRAVSFVLGKPAPDRWLLVNKKAFIVQLFGDVEPEV